MFTAVFPILSTPDIQRALAFYRDLLGGKVVYQFPATGEPGYVGLDLGSAHLGIGYSAEARAGAPGQRFSLWVDADDCDRAVDKLRAAGTTIVSEPADQPWGERIARVLDPDGNEIIIGTSARER